MEFGLFPMTSASCVTFSFAPEGALLSIPTLHCIRPTTTIWALADAGYLTGHAFRHKRYPETADKEVEFQLVRGSILSRKTHSLHQLLVAILNFAFPTRNGENGDVDRYEETHQGVNVLIDSLEDSRSPHPACLA